MDEDHLVGLSALLYTLREHATLSRADLLDICAGYPLRAGTLPWASALQVAIEMKLVVTSGQEFSLSGSGAHLSCLIEDDMEPSEEFAGAVTVLVISRSSTRYTLAHARLDGMVVDDPRGTATPLLEQLTEVGLLATAGASWELQGGEFSPLLVGLLVASAKGSPVANDVGRIGEQLSLMYCRDNGGDPFHASVVSDAFGFDILCRGTASNVRPSVAVEAKGTTAAGPFRFFVSRHELRVARALRGRYHIELWGAIDVTAPVEDNYARLRGMGFPRLVQDPFQTIYTQQPQIFDGFAIGGGAVMADGLTWEVP